MANKREWREQKGARGFGVLRPFLFRTSVTPTTMDSLTFLYPVEPLHECRSTSECEISRRAR